MKVARLIAAFGVAAVLTGCASIEWEVEASCEQRCSGEDCKIGGKIKGKSQKSASLLDAALSSTTVPDAAQFAVEVGASASKIPSTGYVTLTLLDSASGSVQASRVFSWAKVGSDLRLSDPNAVNAWAMNTGGSADALAYELHPFAVVSTPGTSTLTVSAENEGISRATAASTWEYLGVCRYRCQIQ